MSTVCFPTRIRLLRAVAFGACIAGTALHPVLPFAQTSPACVIAGTITSSRLPLPGVVVTLVSQIAGRDLMQLAIDQGRHRLERPRVAALPLVKQIGDIRLRGGQL